MSIIKNIYLTAWYALQSTWHFLSNNADTLVAIATVIGLIYAARQYYLAKQKQEQQSQPYVFVDLESNVTNGLLDLVIHNSGSSPAVNIRTKFTPNIQLHAHTPTRINSYKILKQLKFLPNDKSMRFFFGSVIGGHTQICKQFEVNLEYEDINGNRYSNEQIIDPRDLLELTYIERKGTHDIAKSVNELAKSLKSIEKCVQSLEDTIQTANRNHINMLHSYTANELLTILKNINNYGIQNETWHTSLRRDIQDTAKVCREKILIQPNLSPDDRELIKNLNILIIGRNSSGNDDYKDTLATLASLV